MSDQSDEWLEALEITDRSGTKTGKFQLILRNEQHDVFGLCNHEHGTAEEALACPEGRIRPWDCGINIQDCELLSKTINTGTVAIYSYQGYPATRIVTDPPERKCPPS